MLFLIDYDLCRGEVVDLFTFTDDQRHEADAARLDLELRLTREGIKREVVIIEADSEEALRKSHARYFSDPAALVRAIMTSTSSPTDGMRVLL